MKIQSESDYPHQKTVSHCGYNYTVWHDDNENIGFYARHTAVGGVDRQTKLPIGPLDAWTQNQLHKLIQGQ